MFGVVLVFIGGMGGWVLTGVWQVLFVSGELCEGEAGDCAQGVTYIVERESTRECRRCSRG